MTDTEFWPRSPGEFIGAAEQYRAALAEVGGSPRGWVCGHRRRHWSGRASSTMPGRISSVATRTWWPPLATA
ncbi:hypothetical protein [Tsukamurella sp. PLM1]|uniref:hypothetical protein n=1 Tax=Tsukamurella sp. PLM1 TaxID=2929795 RepID=UPI0020C17524|nr:hypothetical protein [Tsukamurella sp. PLM1]